MGYNNLEIQLESIVRHMRNSYDNSDQPEFERSIEVCKSLLASGCGDRSVPAICKFLNTLLKSNAVPFDKKTGISLRVNYLRAASDILQFNSSKNTGGINSRTMRTVMNLQDYIRSNFHEMDCSGAHLKRMPAGLWTFTDLRVLKLRDNLLNSIPEDVRHLINLVEIDVQDNILESLPPQIVELKKLVKLRLKGNRISHLGHPKLLAFWLSDYNYGNFLSPDVYKLKETKELHLQDKDILVLPCDIGWLKPLKSLDLRDNRIQSVPIEIINMSGLKKLDLRGNSPSISASSRGLDGREYTVEEQREMLQFENTRRATVEVRRMPEVWSELWRFHRLRMESLAIEGGLNALTSNDKAWNKLEKKVNRKIQKDLEKDEELGFVTANLLLTGWFVVVVFLYFFSAVVMSMFKKKEMNIVGKQQSFDR